MNNVNASIITIGDELLIGQTIDTNSAFIAQELNKIGVWVRRRVAVGDVYDDIWQALDEEGENSDIIIITGGLGPTADDITKPLLCKYFGGKMIVNEKVLAHVKYLFENVFRRSGPMLERNMKQAEVPDVCTVLHNKRGTAPGMLFSPPTPRRGDLESESAFNTKAYLRADPFVYGLLKDFVKEHRSKSTDAEKLLWEIVKGKKMAGFKFRRQHIISTYIADFVSLSEKLIIEVDGLHHQLPENKKSDDERTKELNMLGFNVIRFTNKQVLSETDYTINTILLELKKEKPEISDSEAPPAEGFGEAGPVFISLPGVPHEMKGLMMDEVIPFILKEYDLPAIVHKTAFTAGIGESMLAEMLKEFEPSLPSHIKLAYLPNYGMVKLRLTTTGNNKEEVEKELLPLFEKMMSIVKEYLVSDEDEGLEKVIGKILKAKGKTMGTAESCTGGYIAHLITAIPGSSIYYNGSVVSYSYETKENILGVKKETLEKTGAVSEETVTEMAKGAIKTLNVDYVVAVSGIMGPEGGTEDKPVGTVWIAVADKNKVETTVLHLRFDRQRNIEMTAANALNFLRKFILKN
ncbi:MAG TPA: nicotinamide-nucleotide amidohydrolase family protein [Chitinophagaceae bacterium]|nr:nicotinamide-nucleotide amidohydrolase family protein [Chitinophagaceae bacterium]MBP6477847.1 nicotinamide-nucleotide amidohydrolase family protein [Chitinophagaceae bacterium]MBP7109376.1 nicotinamide-nucleotide amidohydrolase family protein [Chitinophagaceae bacterium]MBP7315458.1 nicotinamide-nucleotide amidohydrolase family protein [Chitinophagaceae bacterium]HQV54198.1 nicotinamide-nucleotide amidohydrolase family protein [Chitinophagaceae bacterium]